MNVRSIVAAAAGVGFGYALALAGAFEQALDAGDPVWSSVFGFPFPHHYLLGFIILGASLVCLIMWRLSWNGE